MQTYLNISVFKSVFSHSWLHSYRPRPCLLLITHPLSQNNGCGRLFLTGDKQRKTIPLFLSSTAPSFSFVQSFSECVSFCTRVICFSLCSLCLHFAIYFSLCIMFVGSLGVMFIAPQKWSGSYTRTCCE